MRVAFIHDHRFKAFRSEYFSVGQFSNKTWERFLSFSDDLTVIARYESCELDDIKSLRPVSSSNVKFDCFNYISLKDRLFTSRIKKQLVEKLDNIDVVVCRLPSFLGRLAFDVASELNKTVVVELVGCPYDSWNNHGSLAGKVFAPFEARIIKNILSKSQNTLYVTSSFLQKRYPSNGTVVSASNVELIDSGVRADIDCDVKVIKFIGSLKAKYKGLEDLIVALGILKKQGIICTLHVLGSGDRSYYKRIAFINNVSAQIKFSAPLSAGDEVLRWLSEGQLYIQPSHTEGLPRALIEAMSVGLPCIGTNVGGIPELLHKEALVKAKSPENLAKTINKFIKNPELMQRMAQLNIEKSLEFHFEKLKEKRTAFYRSVILKVKK